MKILSLFDGISIAQQALKELNIPVEAYYASEIDKYAISITQKNFPNTIQLGDIKKIDSSFYDRKDYGLQEFDLIIGGSPCQDLSIAKKNREGLKGSRSGLFYEFVRLIKEIKPKYFVLENVNSMPKEAKHIITEELWNIEPVMINAALVSAQNRKRLFWIGKRVGDTYKQIEIPQPEDRGILLKDILESEVDEGFLVKDAGKKIIKKIDKSVTLRARDYKGFDNYGSTGIMRVGQIGKGGQGDRIYSPEGKSVNLSANGGGRGAKTGLYAINGKQIILSDDSLQVLKEGRTEEGKKSRKEIRKKTGKDSTKRSKEHKAYFGRKGEKANCITTGLGVEGQIVKDFQIRKLTPIECERLMTVSDNYTAKGITEKGEVDISNTQRYKALGNGFSCEVVKHILDNMLKQNK